MRFYSEKTLQIIVVLSILFIGCDEPDSPNLPIFISGTFNDKPFHLEMGKGTHPLFTFATGYITRFHLNHYLSEKNGNYVYSSDYDIHFGFESTQKNSKQRLTNLLTNNKEIPFIKWEKGGGGEPVREGVYVSFGESRKYNEDFYSLYIDQPDSSYFRINSIKEISAADYNFGFSIDRRNKLFLIEGEFSCLIVNDSTEGKINGSYRVAVHPHE